MLLIRISLGRILISNVVVGQIGTSLLYFYFYLLCYAAVLLKFTYYAQYYAQEQKLLSDYIYTILHEQFTTYNRKFLKTLLLEYISERYQVHLHA